MLVLIQQCFNLQKLYRCQFEVKLVDVCVHMCVIEGVPNVYNICFKHMHVNFHDSDKPIFMNKLTISNEILHRKKNSLFKLNSNFYD